MLFVFILFSCEDSQTIAEDSPVDNPTQKTPNILLIIADDMGLDASPGYNLGAINPTMPNLQGMVNNGVTFNNVWANPTCTPTRASIITGKYGFRTGVTKVGDELSTTEISLQEYLNSKNSGYSHAVIGKWHLSSDAAHPLNMGIDYYAGLLSGGVQSYTNWNFTENSTTNNSTEYTTSKFTDLAIDWVDNQTKPWFLWLAYNAPHTPFHLPPNNLHTQGSLPSDEASIDANPRPYYMAMLEAMDTEMGRLLNSMSDEDRENTLIIFIGDNGTPNQVVQEYNRRRAKGSIYQGGIQVPMIISGKNVTRLNQTEDALINAIDLFATIAEIGGLNTPEINDSKSFKELLSNSNESREYIYAEIGTDSGGSDYAVRNTTHKYIFFDNGAEEFYNLSIDPFETNNLLEESLSVNDNAIKEELISKSVEIRQ